MSQEPEEQKRSPKRKGIVERSFSLLSPNLHELLKRDRNKPRQWYVDNGRLFPTDLGEDDDHDE